MTSRYYIELSRKDYALVSYFPGLQLKKEPDVDWLGTVLLPAIMPITKRKTKIITELPLTFWVTVRPTARHKAEIFLFTTPAYPGAKVEPAIRQALQSIPEPDGKIHAGHEPIPAEALPYCQIFRGEIIRFYTTVGGHDGFYVPVVGWGDRAPELSFTPIAESTIAYINEEGGALMVRADIAEVLDGNYFRKFQQALSTIAREEKVDK